MGFRSIRRFVRGCAVCQQNLLEEASSAKVKSIIQQLQSLDKTALTLKILRPQDFSIPAMQFLETPSVTSLREEMNISMGKKPNASLGLQMNFSSFSAGCLC